MVDKIIELSNQLREAGIPVSVRSTKDAADIYKNPDIGKNTLKTALRAIYIKDKYDLAKFNRIFDGIFKKQFGSEESKVIEDRGKAYSGDGPKSNKYVIKKTDNRSKAFKKEKLNNKMLKELAGKPLLEEIDQLEREGELMNTDLTKLNRFDPRMLEICQRLGRKIANKRSRRNLKANSNKIDMRRTIRSNMRYGGTPVNLIKAKPRNRKNQHLFLNDISGSCEWISSWFFMLMYSCKSAFKNSRTFEFDNKVIETTEALSEDQMLNAFVKVKDLRIRNMMVHGTSNMYTAFEDFIKVADLNNKSYVIMLTDCRDWAGPKVDGKQASVQFVEEMVQLSKKVIILNPEDRYKWDVVDSCVSLYEDVGAHVYEVNTLNQLAQFVESL
ncbi:MAG: VWA domain-containing protein [Methanobrevibacter sp.]|uniref:VWA domain-containing protein n=1 Tax=Methanobrevibacter sp. TaxID=66852 RepID=UPI0026E04E6B|nr:VWA domain-containing protein [Methanobrevibacter sp.]MDO5848385.1 VWA domain-containing protein [Methanobrevibacter sp.]